MTEKVDMNLVPEMIKSLVTRADKNNPYTNANEKFMALSQLENIVLYCTKSIDQIKKGL